MARTLCINEHTMWNGDGEVIVEAFSEKFVEDFSKKNPDVKLYSSNDGEFGAYDIFDGTPENELEIWRCRKCESVAVFLQNHNQKDIARLDYVVVDLKNVPAEKIYKTWEKFFVLDFNNGMDEFCEKMDNRDLMPIEAFLKYAKELDKLFYAYVGADKKMIVVADNAGKPFRLYELKSETKF